MIKWSRNVFEFVKYYIPYEIKLPYALTELNLKSYLYSFIVFYLIDYYNKTLL